ncbi:Lar family restriction alleviation protein [Salmonella enterica subsp. enterica serovar Saintpaul]|nr:Lar family restriction alleviation protein [Salmonella enterica subsp. enterica serovar Saintpaul]
MDTQKTDNFDVFGSDEDYSCSYEDDGNHSGATLLPCPFCGSENLEVCNTHTPSYWVACLNCGGEKHTSIDGYPALTSPELALGVHMSAFKMAVNGWNQRFFK